MNQAEPYRTEEGGPRPLYLIVQRDAARIDVLELPQGGRVTIGRAPSNRIVLNDSKCSRQHCELYFRAGQWFLRDLESRNGVLIDGDRLQGDHPLRVGELATVGSHEIVLTAFHPDQHSRSSTEQKRYEIIERQTGTQFDAPEGVHKLAKGREGATELFRLARLMAADTSEDGLCQTVLQGLLVHTSAQVGGVLLSTVAEGEPTVRDLKLKSSSGGDGTPPFSTYLSQSVLEDGQAILAHDISRNAALASQKSIEAIRAESAICTPIRHQGHLLGVIHLYSLQADSPLTHTDLEFCLAVADQMGDHLQALRDRQRLEQGLDLVRSQVANLQDQLAVESELVGFSESMDGVRKIISRVAPTDATVLIRGESGVGKELVARALHLNSRRRDAPFVCVNCAALTETLLESELFGHEKGSFTGAAAQRAGKFEQADGGTLFLDEIGEMNPEIQAKFLRALEGQAFERVGGGKEIQVDVRVVTATNRDLEQAVREGKFRRDLFFRLQVIELVVPPLRSHRDDIPAIAQHFVERFSRNSARKIRGLTTAAVRKLQDHNWPGNVRELRNVVERAVILAEDEVLGPEDLILTRLRLDDESSAESPEMGKPVGFPEPVETRVDPMVDLFGSFIQQELSLEDIDRIYIQAVLDSQEWNKSAAARLLKIERTTLDRRLKKYGMNRPDGDTDPDMSVDDSDE
ncbi:MAG: sigma 54-interacting transcriptional regulator [Planctomycetaceae bacterium]|nr:sigma 54-interacting transcriptional regulator [Planctomycetaceae bacterium]